MEWLAETAGNVYASSPVRVTRAPSTRTSATWKPGSGQKVNVGVALTLTTCAVPGKTLPCPPATEGVMVNSLAANSTAMVWLPETAGNVYEVGVLGTTRSPSTLTAFTRYPGSGVNVNVGVSPSTTVWTPGGLMLPCPVAPPTTDGVMVKLAAVPPRNVPRAHASGGIPVFTPSSSTRLFMRSA